MLFHIALRNLWLNRFKTLVVGSVLVLGTSLVIVGSGLLDSVDTAMRTSLVNSVSGHFQIYSAKGKDEFQLFGNMDGSMPDSGFISDFSKLNEALKKVASVRTVVPMGIDFAVTTTDNILERKLLALREAVTQKNTESITPLRKHVRRIIRVMDKELRNAASLIDISRYRKSYGDPDKALARARTAEFWQNFDKDPFNALEYLENDVGPLALAEDMIWIRYLGTDTELFKKTFDRFEIVDGKEIPPGKRGFLFNKRVYENMVKNKTARRLDKLKEILDDGRTIADCTDCATWIRRNKNQVASLIFQFDDAAAAKVSKSLRAYLKPADAKASELKPMMQSLMQMDDSNFRERYALFYKEVAPHISLYTVPIGSELVLTAFARGGGYARKIPVKVYGTFRFRSLDKSPLAGGFNLIDIMSFRDLYGYMTTEKKREQKAIRAEVGLKDVKRDDADKMFEEGGDLVEEGKSTEIDAVEDKFKVAGARFTAAIHKRSYSKSELWNGVVLNAAVMLKDGADAAQAKLDIEAAIKAAGLDLKVIDWRKASGLVGQMVSVIRAVLFGAVFIIFVVALIIINNSLLMTTLERTREIGTMRAIGAQRGFIMRMFIVEAMVLALVFGGIGLVLGSSVMMMLKSQGIPATTDFFYFLFAGPRLRPEMQAVHLIAAGVIITIVTLVSTVYPARVATRITPREAMAGDE